MDRAELKHIEKQIFQIQTEADFSVCAMKLFRYQYENVPAYHCYCDTLHRQPDVIHTVKEIPFIPIDFFRTQRIATLTQNADLVFSSSGTTGKQTSHHEVPFPELYEQTLTQGFEYFYGNIQDYCIIALLPSYLEREGSSLVYMAQHLMQLSAHPLNGFYLHDLKSLSEKLLELKQTKQKTLLIGVTYALLDLAATYPIHFPELIIMETGGMKGKRREMVREEVHETLRQTFGCPHIHSEYGMTELLSQAYSKEKGLYATPPWMRVMIRRGKDPLDWAPSNTVGGISVIDLANIYSCSFIAIQDLGKMHDDGTFEVLGRFDQSLVRGCNLMVE